MKAAYKNNFAFYNSSNALGRGAVTSFANNDIVCFTKAIGAAEVLGMVNSRNNAVNFTIPASLAGTTWTNVFGNGTVHITSTYSFGCYQYVVLQRSIAGMFIYFNSFFQAECRR